MPNKNTNSQSQNLKSSQEIRQDIRSYIQNERDTILRKWQCLQESLNTEERIKEQFLRRQEVIKTKAIPLVVQKFIRTLKKSVRNTIRNKGGTPFSVVRHMFIYWDADKSGELGLSELESCLNSLGIKTTLEDRKAIIKYYDSGKGNGEMTYQPLLDDMLIGEPTALETIVDDPDTERDGMRFATEQDKRAVMPAVVKDFIEAVRSVLKSKMQREGGTELSHMRDAFLAYDHDYSNALDVDELMLSMKNKFKLTITQEQAQQIIDYYDVKGIGAMNYKHVVADVMRGQPLMLQYQEQTARTIAATRKNLSSNPFIPKPFVPPPNKLVEDFKRKVKIYLEKKMKAEGGSIKSIMRKVFVFWDPQYTGKIYRWEDLQGAVRKFGFTITEDEAKVLMRTYDKDNSGALNYEVLANDILQTDPSFLVDSTSVLDYQRTATSRAPPDVSMNIRKIRDAAEVYARASKGEVEPRDVLMGTFLRFDKTHSGVRISSEDLNAVFRELRVRIPQDQINSLITWFDTNASRRLDYAMLIRQLFGEDVLTKPLSLPTISKAGRPQTTSDVSHDPKETLKQKALKSASRQKLIVAEKLRVQAKLQSIEKQRQAVMKNKKSSSEKTY